MGSQFSKMVRIRHLLLAGTLEAGTRFCLESVKLLAGANKAAADTNEGLRADAASDNTDLEHLKSTELAAEPIVLLLKKKTNQKNN